MRHYPGALVDDVSAIHPSFADPRKCGNDTRPDKLPSDACDDRSWLGLQVPNRESGLECAGFERGIEAMDKHTEEFQELFRRSIEGKRDGFYHVDDCKARGTG